MSEPTLLKIGLTERCNSRCVMCSHTPDMKRTMPLSDVIAILDAFPKAERVQPQHFGEPLLHPQFLEIVGEIKRRGKVCWFYTNGSLLDARVADILAKTLTKGDRVIFSVEGDGAMSYEDIRRGLSFDTVVKNMAYLRRVRPYGVAVEARMTDLPEFDRRKAEALWKQHADRVYTVGEEPFGRPVEGRFGSDYDSRTCQQAKSYFIVRENGDTVLCCGADPSSDAVRYGNIYREGIRECWESPNRTRWLAKPHPACLRCNAQWVRA